MRSMMMRSVPDSSAIGKGICVFEAKYRAAYIHGIQFAQTTPAAMIASITPAAPNCKRPV